MRVHGTLPLSGDCRASPACATGGWVCAHGAHCGLGCVRHCPACGPAALRRMPHGRHHAAGNTQRTLCGRQQTTDNRTTCGRHLHRHWAHPLPHLHRYWAHPCHIHIGTDISTETGRTPATSAPRLGSPPPHLHRHWAHPPAHICTGTGLPLPRPHRDSARCNVATACCRSPCRAAAASATTSGMPQARTARMRMQALICTHAPMRAAVRCTKG